MQWVHGSKVGEGSGATQAANVNGAITFAGGAQLDAASVNSATTVTGWLDQLALLPTVQSVSGDFGSVPIGSATTFAAPWSFNSGALPSLWSVGGFTFDLTSSSIDFQGGGFVNVSGVGTVSGNGFDPTAGIWTFTTQDPPAGVVGTTQDPVFSFSASGEFFPQTVPDGGATVGLLGLALLGMGGLRRQLKTGKS